MAAAKKLVVERAGLWNHPLSMSEFKFACPICGQHITADSANTGSQLECPTCYRKIIVPSAPTSTDPKFILSAAEANKPRPPQPSLPKLEPISQPPARTAMTVAVIILAILLCLAGAAAFVFRGKIFGGKKPNAEQLAGTEGDGNADSPTGGRKTIPVPVVSNNIAWNLDLTETAFPENATAGKLRGEFVACNRNTLVGGALGFRQATKGLPDLSATIYFLSKQPEDLSGKTFNLTTNDTTVPRVVLRWKEGKENKAQTFTNGYALKLELGDLANNRITGRIYLSLPDDAQSRIAGTFTADIRKPSAPKSHPPKHK